MLLCPVWTVALEGTESPPLLLVTETPIALVAALFSDTVQVLEALLPRVDGVHDSDVSCAGALAVSVKVCEIALRLAVRSAV